tara:strand:- start:176 stop:385 length:210 start_codon:yes stop_codon:yes gene_type:complete
MVANSVRILNNHTVKRGRKMAVEDKIKEEVTEAVTNFKKIRVEFKKPWVLAVLAGIAVLVLYNVFTGNI